MEVTVEALNMEHVQALSPDQQLRLLAGAVRMEQTVLSSMWSETLSAIVAVSSISCQTTGLDKSTPYSVGGWCHDLGTNSCGLG